jgi:hypothetical protein
MKGTLHEDKYTFSIISRSVIHRMNNISDTSSRENQNTQFVFNNFFFFRKSCNLWDNVEKYCRAGQATDDNMAYAHCMLDTQGYKCTYRLCITHCFSTATMVERTRLIITLYVHLLSLFILNMVYVTTSSVTWTTFRRIASWLVYFELKRYK